MLLNNAVYWNHTIKIILLIFIAVLFVIALCLLAYEFIFKRENYFLKRYGDYVKDEFVNTQLADPVETVIRSIIYRKITPNRNIFTRHKRKTNRVVKVVRVKK